MLLNFKKLESVMITNNCTNGNK